jgi:hypothetical protein
MFESKTSWWPLAMVGLVLVAVLVSGCASCRRCRGGGGGGGGGPGPGPRSQAAHGFDDDGLRERLRGDILLDAGPAATTPGDRIPAPALNNAGT